MGNVEAWVILYYKYQKINPIKLKEIQDAQLKLCKRLYLLGRVRIGTEGINGTLFGSKENLEVYMSSTTVSFPDIDWKISKSDEEAFDSLSVRLVDCIVGCKTRNEKFDPEMSATHLSPEQFHQMAKMPDTLLLDVRNSYEYAVGHFENALNPETRSFSRFGEWIEGAKNQISQYKKILMYCTGGVRCETASIQLKKSLPASVSIYQLRGGIHRYLEHFGRLGLFKGKNFVFDKRMIQSVEEESCKDEVVGTCFLCATLYDHIKDQRRCFKCRILLLICDACHLSTEGRYWCKDHIYLDPKQAANNREIILHHKLRIENALKEPRVTGRKNKKKRQALTRQYSEILNLLHPTTTD